jgi:hypothetical protein
VGARRLLDGGLFRRGGHGEGCWTRPALKGVSLCCGRWIGRLFTYKNRHSGSLCVAIIGRISHRALEFEDASSE